MDHRFFLILSALAAPAAHAGYAVLADPPGFTRNVANMGGGFGYATNPANDRYFGNTAYQKNALVTNVAGQKVTMPASYRFAANAPRFAAAAIFAHPVVRTASAIATWMGVASLVWDAGQGIWTRPDPNARPSDGYEYRIDSVGNVSYDTGWVSSPSGACNSWTGAQNVGSSVWRYEIIDATTCRLRVRNTDTGWSAETSPSVMRHGNSCPVGWYSTPAGCTQTPQPKQVNEPEFIEEATKHPMPDGVPGQLPYPTPLPVEIPIINPEPVADPVPRPVFVPTGDPVKNPDYPPDPAANPQPNPLPEPYIQPGVQIVPRSTPQEPWRVETKPVNRPKTDDEPAPDPVSDPVTDANGNPVTPPADKPLTPEQKGLCDQYPNIVACQALDKPEEVKLKTEELEFELEPEGGFGGSASCPSPITASLGGRQLSFSWQPLCNSLALVKPMILAFGWLMAAFIVIGHRGQE